MVNTSMQASNPLFLKDEELERMIELLFHAYQELFSHLPPSLGSVGLDELDFKILYAINRGLCCNVSELTAQLKVSKQTTSRRVRRLVAAGLLLENCCNMDRRKRNLGITPSVDEMLSAISERQKRYLKTALQRTGSTAVRGFDEVLSQLCRRVAST